MTVIIAWLIGRGLSRRVAGVVAWASAIALLIAVSIGAWAVLVRRHDRAVIAKHEAGVQLDIERAGRAADRSLTERRADGERAICFERKDFDNAARHIPPEGLTRRQRLDLCIELRDGGTDTTLLPQCGDLRAGAASGRDD